MPKVDYRGIKSTLPNSARNIPPKKVASFVQKTETKSFDAYTAYNTTLLERHEMLVKALKQDVKNSVVKVKTTVNKISKFVNSEETQKRLEEAVNYWIKNTPNIQ